MVRPDVPRGDRSDRRERRSLASERAPAGRVSRLAASECNKKEPRRW